MATTQNYFPRKSKSAPMRDWKDTNKYVAIPQTEIDATEGTEFELKQNPGY